ncbi:hypothetical protein [Bacillus massilinigeriensis]|uniref:hypothetical protein n=1 Tax=Bacillus mediterraneensis TaxID=1805474 RepID=UPI000A863E02|nr:hypothetical protein [Bacillus mediterraneensis]
MKRDLQINYGILDNIIKQLHTYKNALDKMEASLEKINAFISLNEGESVEAWEDQLQKIKREIKNYRKQVKDLTNLFENYVERTTAHIAPLSRNAMMRVDRNDIAYNLDQIRDSVVMNMQGALMATHRSPSFLAAMIDNPTDEEKEKSKSNELKLDKIRSRILSSQTRFNNEMDELYRIHKTKVIEFENTDDTFSDKAANLKNKYTNFWEGVGDVFEVVGEVSWGLLKGLFIGVVGLIGGVLILAKDAIVVSVSSQIPDPVEPDFLKKEADATIDKYKSAAMKVIDDPGGVFEAIGQSFSDTYEKEGIAYLVGSAAPSFIPAAGVVGKLGKVAKVAKVAGKVPVSKTKGFSGNIKANIDNLIGGNKAFSGFKNRVSGQISSAASQFTKAVKAPFSNKFVQGALSRARSELAQVGRALGGLKIPVGIEKQVVSTGFNNITTYGLKTKTINDQFTQFAKVVDRSTKGTDDVTLKKKSVPDWFKERWEAGNNFNKENRPRYPYNEVELEAKEVGGKKYVVDSYAPNKEIVSRKFTQLSEVQEKTAKSYLNEITKKYSSGSKISNGTFNPNALKGGRLKGELILEIPVQNKPIPQTILDEATKNRIIIRDFKGKVYN